MIDIKVNNGMVNVNAQGSIVDLCVDTCSILRGIYDSIKKNNQEIADFYKKAMTSKMVELAFTDEHDLLSGLNAIQKLIAVIDDLIEQGEE